MLAVGNSNGDVPRLTYVQKHPCSLSLLIHDDDDTGQGDVLYDAGAEEALACADTYSMTVVSAKNDWASRGIGAAVCRRLAADGHDVVVG